MPVVAGLMPTSRAPVRLTAVARSALPIVKSKNRKSRPLKTMRGGHDQQRLGVDDEAGDIERRVGQRLGAHAFGTEEHQARGPTARNAAPPRR